MSATRREVINREETPEFEWGRSDVRFGVSHRLRSIDDPLSHISRDKRFIRARMGDLSDIRLTGNRVLVAIWITGARKTGSIILTDNTAEEDKWQGKTGLLVAMGPHAFQSDENRVFLPEETPQVGDWVLTRKGDGHMLTVWGHECMMMDDTAIRAILDRPDSVY